MPRKRPGHGKCQAWAVGLEAGGTRRWVPASVEVARRSRVAGSHGLVVVVARAALPTTIVRVSWAAER